MKDNQEGVVIPLQERKPELEERVSYFLETIPRLPRNDRKPVRTKEPEKADPYELRAWRLEEIRRIREGHFGMSGKMYFWYNYVKLQDIKTGLTRPQFRMCQAHWFDEIIKAQNSEEWGLIGVKRRRIGASWLEAADVLHDAMTHSGINIGMTSKGEQDSIELFKKTKQIYDNLPEWLRPRTTAGNSRMHMDFSYWGRDSKGNKVRRGTRSSITVKAPTDTAWEGSGLFKSVFDECFGVGTLVRMGNGDILPIESIRIGDKVMGMDGKPKTVEALTKGQSDLYLITPNKGDPYICNGSHLLTLTFNGTEAILDIPARDFYKLPTHKQRYYQQLKAGWDYGKNALPIDPYWLGLWLGDGFSSGATVCAADEEIKQYLEFVAPSTLEAEVTVSTVHGNVYRYNFHNNYRRDHGGIRNRLKRIKVWENKHIPKRYLRSCRLDRLRLLAGIIDSDGHRHKNGYEVVFKSEKLSRGLVELCNSLGFYVSIKEKIATMNRADGTRYSCPVYRVGIFGTRLYEVPCKVIRKRIYQENVTPRRGRKSPERSGFTISKVDDGEYYGITLLESPYFLLHDGTVVHNCGKIENLRQLYAYTEPALMKGTRRVGTPIIFGTAGDITAEGADFMDMYYNAEIYKLKQFFFGGWMGLDGLVDEFGNDNVEDAVRWIVYERFRREGLDKKTYTDWIQQYPLTVGEAFTSNETYGVGNTVKINKQINSLSAHPPMAKRGTFRLDANQKPVFVPNPKGAAIIYEEPDALMENLYIGGADTTDHPSGNPDSNKVSGQCLLIMKKRKGTSPPKIVFELYDKPNLPRDFYDQAILALMYYGNATVMIENNRRGMIDHFEEYGLKHLLAPTPNGYRSIREMVSWSIGYNRNKTSIAYGDECISEYIEDYYEWIPSVELLKECLVYGQKNTDRVAAFAAVLIHLKDDKWEATERANHNHLFKNKLIRLPNGSVRRISR